MNKYVKNRLSAVKLMGILFLLTMGNDNGTLGISSVNTMSGDFASEMKLAVWGALVSPMANDIREQKRLQQEEAYAKKKAAARAKKKAKEKLRKEQAKAKKKKMRVLELAREKAEQELEDLREQQRLQIERAAVMPVKEQEEDLEPKITVDETSENELDAEQDKRDKSVEIQDKETASAKE